MGTRHKPDIRNKVGDYRQTSLELCREKIMVSKIISTLQANGLNGKPLDEGRRASLKILLDKALPNLASQELTIGAAHPFAVLPAVIPGETDWEEAFTPAPKATEH